MKPKPILVSGAHRSGTTWVGKILAYSPSIHYIHEPFNIDYSVYKIKPDYWFQYVTKETEGRLYEQIKQLIAPQTQSSSCKDNNINQFFNFFYSGPKIQRALVKDPIAVFSADWLAERFNMDVVIMIRHPAAFVDSIRDRNWTHDFNHFLKQPLLMKEHLADFKEEIMKFTKKQYDIIDQAILLWKLIYYMVSKYQQKHKDWLYIRHEDLSLNPVKGFREIFRYLHIKLLKSIKITIEDHSNKGNPADGDVHSIKRNSKAVVKKWQKKFTQEEIKRIRDEVEYISREFYSDEDW